MSPARSLAVAALLGVAPVLVTAVAAAPAGAHGAPDSPISRAVACGPQGGANARTAACQAARAASGAHAFDRWDNLRVAGVNGRDREVVPDGKLCSGGIEAYKGLDLARSDWPATRVTAGAAFTFTYRETIPHQGTFRMYVTKDGWTPTRSLRWSDIETKPFLTASDPPLRDRAYVMKGRLPAGKTGRHVIYTIWQNTSTPDTYYSCSDVLFRGPASAPKAKPKAGAAPTTAKPPAEPPAAVPADPVPAAAVKDTGGWPLATAAVVGAGALVAAGGAAVLVRRRRRS